VGGFLWWRQPGPESGLVQLTDSPPPVVAAPPPAQPVDAPRYELPPLAESDAFLRERARELSANALVGAWASGRGLAANLAVVIENAARGLSPARHLPRLRPAGTFRVLPRGDRFVIDPRNYQRFAALTGAVSSIDPAMAARVYTGIKRLLQMAYDELGNQEPIDAAVARAVGQVLGTPVVEGEIGLRTGSAGIGYVFADAALEARPGVQKQLIRMGPGNQRAIQSTVRRFAEAAGIGQQQ
jgi:hypothetical protein